MGNELSKKYGFNDAEELIKAIVDKKENISFVRFITADILGERECSFTVPAHTLTENIDTLKKGFDASSLYPERINESDKLALFDPTTARVFPIEYSTKTTGYEKKWKEVFIYGDVINPKNSNGNKPYIYDSRSKLKTVLKKAEKLVGADKVFLGPELEFFLFKADSDGKPLIIDNKPITLDKGSYFKGGRQGIVRKEIQLMLVDMGYEFEYDHHEVAHSQHEIDVHYMNAIDVADFIMTYRYVVKRVANEHKLFASFMPKPLLGVNGSGMHVHQSLFKDGKNLFYDTKDEHNLSETAYQYMAGLMKYAPEITLFTNQWTNSYRRLVPGFEAPVYICWDPQNRSNLIRKPEYEPGNEKATRIELRSPDPSSNPYLAFSMILAAGLKGIEEKLPTPKPSEKDVYHLSQKEREELDIKNLPGSLEEAISLAENSSLAKEVLGERFLNDYINIKTEEVKKYQEDKNLNNKERLTDYELNELLPIL
jgi:glutamine synthetase